MDLKREYLVAKKLESIVAPQNGGSSNAFHDNTVQFLAESTVKNESKRVLTEAYRVFVEEEQAPEQNPGLFKRAAGFINKMFKKVAGAIQNNSQFQKIVNNKSVEQLIGRTNSFAQKVKGEYAQAAGDDGSKKKMAMLVGRDAGIAAVSILAIYLSFRGANALAKVVQQRYGKVAGILMKILGLPIAGALSLLVMGAFTIYREECTRYIQQTYGSAKQSAGNAYNKMRGRGGEADASADQ